MVVVGRSCCGFIALCSKVLVKREGFKKTTAVAK